MKYLLFLFFAMLTLHNCKKQNLPIGVPIDPIDSIPVVPVDTTSHIIEFGKASMYKNGALWKGQFKSYFYWTDSVFELRANLIASNSIEEKLFISDIPCRVGKYLIEHFPTNKRNQIPESFFTLVHEGDQPLGDFFVDTLRHDHFVEVLHFNPIDSTVEGRFQVFLGLDPNMTNYPGIPDSMFLTEGKFYLKVK